LAGAAAGIVYFWAMGAVVQLNVDQYAFESGASLQQEVVPLLFALVAGIGAGSLLAGRLSKRGIDAGSAARKAAAAVMSPCVTFLLVASFFSLNKA